MDLHRFGEFSASPVIGKLHCLTEENYHEIQPEKNCPLQCDNSQAIWRLHHHPHCY